MRDSALAHGAAVRESMLSAFGMLVAAFDALAYLSCEQVQCMVPGYGGATLHA